MRRGLIALAIALLVVLAGLAAVLINPPVGFVKNRLTAWVKDSTGRDLAIQGKASLKLFPSIAMRLEDVSLSQPPGFVGDPFLRAGAAEAHAALWPLLQGRLEISRIALADARLQLLTDKQGRNSWQFPKGAEGQSLGVSVAPVGELALSRSTVTFSDERSPARIAFTDVNAAARQVALDAPLSAAFDLIWNSERIKGSVNARSLAALADGAPTRTAITLVSGKGNVEFEGDLSTAEPFGFQGKASAGTPSLRALAAWFDVSLPRTDGFGKAGLQGEMRGDATSISFTNARLSLDETTAEGTLGLDFSRRPPRITGTLAADRVDVARYIPAPKAALTRSAPEPAFEIVPIPLNDSLKAYLKAAEIRGPAAAAIPETAAPATLRAPLPAWSTDPFDVEPLKALDADLALSVRALKYHKAEVGVPKLSVALDNGKLALEAAEVKTHGGVISAKTVLDAKPQVPTFAASARLNDVDVHGLLSDLGLEGYVKGKTTGEAQISGAGRSERELVSSLTGRVKARVGEGSVIGYDVKRVTETWQLPPYNAAARTPFERIEADVKLDKGVAESQLMELAGPVVGAKADGSARLVPRQLEYNARVSFPNLWSFAVRIFGSFAQIRYDVDWWSTLFSRATPAATRLKTAESLDLKDPELAGLLERAIEKSAAATTRSPDDLDPDVLRALLKRAKGE